MSKMAWVELAPDGNVVRVFRNHKAAVAAEDAFPVAEVNRADAVKNVRAQIYLRDGGKCTHCATDVLWDAFEMHERQWRGKGGEISLANSCVLCVSCHQSDPVAGHGKRKPQWSKS